MERFFQIHENTKKSGAAESSVFLFSSLITAPETPSTSARKPQQTQPDFPVP
jgi:hypothetical protein